MGHCITVELTLPEFPGELPAGDYAIGIIVDPLDEILEGNERNNTLASHTQLRVVKADLCHDGITWFSSPSVEHGDLWDCTFDIRNAGDASTGSFDVDFYASPDRTITSDDCFLGTATVLRMGPDSWTHADLHLDSFCDDVFFSGDYYVGVIIDPDNVVDESNERNNTAVASERLHVFGNPRARRDDLSLSWGPPQSLEFYYPSSSELPTVDADVDWLKGDVLYSEPPVAGQPFPRPDMTIASSKVLAQRKSVVPTQVTSTMMQFDRSPLAAVCDELSLEFPCQPEAVVHAKDVGATCGLY
jgi:hypothetical protein